MKSAIDGMEEVVTRAENDLDAMHASIRAMEKKIKKQIMISYVYSTIAIFTIVASMASTAMFSVLRARDRRHVIESLQLQVKQAQDRLAAQTNVIQLERPAQ